MKKKIFVVLSLLLCLGLSFQTIYALDYIDMDKDLSITIHHEIDSTKFSIYKVSDVTKDCQYTLTDDFDDYPIDTDVETSEELRTLAETLQGYVSIDDIQSVSEGKTENGVIEFNHLEPGLYLIVGEQIADDEYVYSVIPTLVYAPTIDGDDYIYDVDITPKYETNEREYSDKKVIKIWKNDSKSVRPSSITIDLYRNKVLYDTVTLNKDNNWEYQWENLSNSDEWIAIEKDVPDHYSLSIVRENNTFVVTNTYHSNINKQSDEKIPLTGQLWWPVPVLALFGLSFSFIGWMKKKDNKYEEK